ncbi:MAG: hypothetical protein CL694_01990 [Chloroflexi bacterium]|nr:hypothetical protein [Chloroflexota bacterium]
MGGSADDRSRREQSVSQTALEFAGAQCPKSEVRMIMLRAFDKLRPNGVTVVPFVASLSNHLDVSS